MGEPMTHEPVSFDPVTREGRHFAHDGSYRKGLDPIAHRGLKHRAQQTPFWTSLQVHGARAIERYEGGAPLRGPRAFRRFARELLGHSHRPRPALTGKGALAAERTLWHTDEGAEIHQPLSKVARTLFWNQRFGQ